MVNAEGDTASNLLQTLEHIRNIFSHNTKYLSSGNIFSQQILAKSAPIAQEDTQVGNKNNFGPKILIGIQLEHKTCDILAVERLRFMRFNDVIEHIIRKGKTRTPAVLTGILRHKTKGI